MDKTVFLTPVSFVGVISLAIASTGKLNYIFSLLHLWQVLASIIAVSAVVAFAISKIVNG